MINVERTFKKILRDWGHDVYIQRILSNGNHSETFERVTTRHVGPSGVKNANAANEFSEGIDVSFDAVYYFESNVNPKEGDRIYENYSMKSTRDYTMFKVVASTPVRGRQGKISYWIVGATRER
jgi:hypothetical protein